MHGFSLCFFLVPCGWLAAVLVNVLNGYFLELAKSFERIFCSTGKCFERIFSLRPGCFLPDLCGACIGRIVFEKRGELLRNVVSEFVWISSWIILDFFPVFSSSDFFLNIFGFPKIFNIYCIVRIVFEKRGEELCNIVHESCQAGKQKPGRSWDGAWIGWLRVSLLGRWGWDGGCWAATVLVVVDIGGLVVVSLSLLSGGRICVLGDFVGQTQQLTKTIHSPH